MKKLRTHSDMLAVFIIAVDGWKL